jgi:NDP-sugar pyrophosphorylase family protein/lipopolysaccharide/colanic/teichoic acid biosynthesis glycosyltransferase
MKAVILPTAATTDLAPLTSWFPEFLLPVVNKPVVEHLIELLVRHDVKEILLILKHMPYETEEYFGDGSRWGVHLSYSLLSTYRGIADALEHIEASTLEGSFLCLPADMVIDLDISSLVNVHPQEGEVISLAQTSSASDLVGLHPRTVQDLRSLEGNPLIATREAFMLIPRIETPGAHGAIPDAPSPDRTVMVNTCKAPGVWRRIQSPADLLTVNRSVLEGHYPGILIPGKMVEPGIWVGRHCRIHPGVRQEPPFLIGDHCNIQSGAVIGSGSVIGNQVIIDEGAAVTGSLVLDRTYVGAHTEIRDAVVRKNWMLQIPTMLTVHLGDDLILGDLERKSLATQGGRLLNVALALVLLLLASPLVALLCAYHLVFPSKKFLMSEKRLGGHGPINLEGKLVPEPFDFYLFRSGNRLVRKLPGLVNVIRGDLNLVGVSALDEADLARMPEDWREMRAGAPVGLFHLWELEARDDLEWEERMVIENYYAASRSQWGDLKILGKGLMAFTFR